MSPLRTTRWVRGCRRLWSFESERSLSSHQMQVNEEVMAQVKQLHEEKKKGFFSSVFGKKKEK